MLSFLTELAVSKRFLRIVIPHLGIGQLRHAGGEDAP